ncbi:OmpP1/FadL family transporter [Hydrogenimonas sp.]
MTFLRASLALPLLATALFATNGDLLIGLGAKTRAMGGAGIAFGHGSQSTLVNPALIATAPCREASVSATFFYPDIRTKVSSMEEYARSGGDFYVIPSLSVARPLGEHWFVGAGMWGTAGLGTDFAGTGTLFEMKTQLMLMQISLPVAYRTGGWSFGVAPIVQYGELEIAYDLSPMPVAPSERSDDVGFGFSAGLTYDFSNGLILGAVYKSPIKMRYEGVLSKATFQIMGDTLEQPAEYGVGFDYSRGRHTLAADYKRIGWGSVTGYEEFAWRDQDVYAVGYEYATPEWALRVGYNYAKTPIRTLPPSKAVLNLLNLVGFPATAEAHYTAGAGYRIDAGTSMDLAFVYAPNKRTEADLTGLVNEKVVNEHREISFTVQFNYEF